MPSSVRSRKKVKDSAQGVKVNAAAIAFSILGTPPNMRDHKTARQQHIDEELLFQNTARVK